MDAIGPILGPAVPKVGLALLLEPKVFNPACIVAGTLIPCHQTIKAIESSSPVARGKRDQMLLYWMSFAALTAAESVVGPAITKMRFYPQLKFALLLWLQLPQTHGARQLYQRARPTLVCHMPKVDRCLEVSSAHLAAAASSFYSTYKVPIDQLALLLRESTVKLREFLRWLSSDDDEGQGNSGPSSQQSPQEQHSADALRGNSGHHALPNAATELHRANSDASSSWVDADLGS